MNRALLIVVLLFAAPAWAGTVTFTDPTTGEPTNTVELPQDGRFQFRIQAADVNPTILATHSVLIIDDSAQMAPGCYPVESGTTIAVTSELVVAAQPLVTVTGTAHNSVDCTGVASIPSNEIRVEFVPEVPGLLGPLAP